MNSCQYERLPSGWWLLPAAILGALEWVLIGLAVMG